MIRAISLWQPWATLVAIGAKRIETRSWDARYTGVLAIHAAMRKPQAKDFNEAINKALLVGGVLGEELPRGAIICTVNLDATFKVENQTIWPDGFITDYRIPPPEPELSFGNYAVGRFAWLLSSVRKLDRPYECRGRQKWFSVPESVVSK